MHVDVHMTSSKQRKFHFETGNVSVLGKICTEIKRF